MSALQLHASTLIFPSSSKTIKFATNNHVRMLIISSGLSLPKLPNKKSDHEIRNTIRTEPNNNFSSFTNHQQSDHHHTTSSDIIAVEIYAILDAVSDRVEMHENIRQQRDNWHSLLLNSINMITLAATTMVALGTSHDMGMSHFTIHCSSFLLFFAATGMSIVMNKIQPSQLVEEQRNATRLFKELRREIENFLLLCNVPTQKDVDIMIQKVLVLDRAYPLALLGAMLEKFPEKYEPSVWWPKNKFAFPSLEKPVYDYSMERNGWSLELENDMREIIEVVRTKDKEDYERLGNIALKLNKVLAISGPVLTGVATIGSALLGFYPEAGVVAAVAGTVATVINTVEHGGQVGMVFEMYRNCGGFFKLLEESTNYTLEQCDMDRRENGEVFEMKMALKLGRSLSELRDLAKKSSSSRRDRNAISDEFASKLF